MGNNPGNVMQQTKELVLGDKTWTISASAEMLFKSSA
jgi:hypothetical protein